MSIIIASASASTSPRRPVRRPAARDRSGVAQHGDRAPEDLRGNAASQDRGCRGRLRLHGPAFSGRAMRRSAAWTAWSLSTCASPAARRRPLPCCRASSRRSRRDGLPGPPEHAWPGMMSWQPLRHLTIAVSTSGRSIHAAHLCHHQARRGRRNIAGRIIARIEEKGFRIIALKRLRLSQAQAEGFYAVASRQTLLSGSHGLHDVRPLHCARPGEGERHRRLAEAHGRHEPGPG